MCGKTQELLQPHQDAAIRPFGTEIGIFPLTGGVERATIHNCLQRGIRGRLTLQKKKTCIETNIGSNHTSGSGAIPPTQWV